MVNRDLLDQLDKEDVINKKNVLWWQLGFEGRRIFSEEEFNQGLQSESYESWVLNRDAEPLADSTGKKPLTIEKQVDVWIRDDVPILLKDFQIRDYTVPVFVTVKPMSHSWNGWRELEGSRHFHIPFSVYHSPHVRGVVVEKTDEFLFWTPLTFGDHNCFSTIVYRSPKTDLPALVSPISPNKFYKKLITKGWSHGKRAQKKASEFDCNREGYSFVPYYEFDPNQKHVTIYPAPIFEGKLDLPIIIKANSGIPEILGTGYFFSYKEDNVAYYWDLDKAKERSVRMSLIKRLGRL